MSAPTWLLPPSAPSETLSLVTPPDSRIPPAPLLVDHLTTSATDFRPCAPSLHPFGCSRFLLPLGITSVLTHTVIVPALGFSGSTYDACRRDIASQLPQSSVCACGSTGSVSVGHPPVVVSLVTILTPPSLDSAMVCRHWGALGLCLRTISTVTTRGSSSTHLRPLPHSVFIPAPPLIPPPKLLLMFIPSPSSSKAICHIMFSPAFVMDF
ncbi:hypothetical protein PO909_023633 [Leuciscus waleckii]